MKQPKKAKNFSGKVLGVKHQKTAPKNWAIIRSGQRTWTVGTQDENNIFSPEEDFDSPEAAATYLNLRKSLFVANKIP